MSIFRAEVDVFGVAAYPSSPQVVIPFEPREIRITNEDSSDDIFFSLNGTDDHGHLLGGAATVKVSQRVTKVWLKRGGTGVTPINVNVVAES